MLFQAPKTSIHLRNMTFDIQKGYKDIIKVVHVTSMGGFS